MSDDYIENKMEEIVQILASNHELMEKQLLMLERIAASVDDDYHTSSSLPSQSDDKLRRPISW